MFFAPASARTWPSTVRAAVGDMKDLGIALTLVNTGRQAKEPTAKASICGQSLGIGPLSAFPTYNSIAPALGRQAVHGLSGCQGVTPQTPVDGSLDTPEQLVHSPTVTLRKRAGRKAITYALAKGLVRVALGPLMGRAYARTANQCGTLLDQSGGSLKQYWCGHRWCCVCGAIRTARAWHAYGPTVQAWQDAQLVTLTVPNCTANGLRQRVKDMHHAFALVTRAVRRKYGKGAVRMIRTTEATYNAGANTYHPHMHIMVHGADVAESVRDAWLKRWPDARRIAQDIRPATAASVAELFKYATKLSTSDRKLVPLVALDVIYTALRGLRLWQPVGIAALTDEAAGDDTAEMEQQKSTPAFVRPTESIVWGWQQGVRDWVDGATGECLTGYTPDEKREAFIATLENMAVTANTKSTGLLASPIGTAITATPLATHTVLQDTRPELSADSATPVAGVGLTLSQTSMHSTTGHYAYHETGWTAQQQKIFDALRPT